MLKRIEANGVCNVIDGLDVRDLILDQSPARETFGQSRNAP